jgi:preprotein translocase subunit YajC
MDPGFAQFLPIIAIFVLAYFMILRPAQKEKQQRAEMLQALKKDDKVFTTGGIIGVITNLSADGREVTLRSADETKLRVLRTAIHGKYEDGPPPDAKTAASSAQ